MLCIDHRLSDLNALSDPSAEISADQFERTVKKVLGNLKFKLGIEIR